MSCFDTWQIDIRGVNMKLNVLALGLTFGIIWGIGVFCLAWWVMAFEGATHDLLVLGHIYRGFDVSPQGAFVGLIWGLVDGFVGGSLIAIVYNLFAKSKSDNKS